MKTKILLTAFVLYCNFIFSQTSNMDIYGRISVLSRSDEITLKVEKIENNERGGRSGTLKLAVYFSDTYYSGSGRVTGIKVFESEIPRLKGNHIRSGTEATGPWLKKPKEGTYYIVVILLEYDANDDTFYIVASRTLDDKYEYSGGGTLW